MRSDQYNNMQEFEEAERREVERRRNEVAETTPTPEHQQRQQEREKRAEQAVPLGTAQSAEDVANDRREMGEIEVAKRLGKESNDPLGRAQSASDVASERSAIGDPERPKPLTPQEVAEALKKPEAITEATESPDESDESAGRFPQDTLPPEIPTEAGKTIIADEISGLADLIRSIIEKEVPDEFRTAIDVGPGRYVAMMEGCQNLHTMDVIAGDGGVLTTDYVYVGGNRLTVPTKTTNFLKVYLDGVTLPEWVEAMPESQDEDSEVFDVTKNRIHLPGNFGGG